MRDTVQTASQSPCINVCVMHRKQGLCIGCGRTLAEITAWGSLDRETQRDITLVLPERLRGMTRRPGPVA